MLNSGWRFAFIIAIGIAISAISFPAEELCSHASSFSRHKGPIPTFLKPLETWDATDLLRNDVDIDVDPAAKTITGSNTFTLKCLENGLSEFTFRLADYFTITSVTLDGRPISATRLDTANVRALFDLPVALDQQFVLVVSYTGTVGAGQGFGSIVFTTQNSQPLVCTLSEPYYSFTWWPSKDDNTDKALNSIAVTAPNALKVAANGLLQSTSPVGASKTKWSYRCDYPMADYLLFFSMTNYNVWTVNGTLMGGQIMPYKFMVYPTSDTQANRNALQLVTTMVPTYEQRYGPYPFKNEQYGIYQFSFGGGMEHQTFTGQGGGSFTGESLCAHELGHQWWGDMVTCGAWGDIWLNEGFATYSEAIWLETKPGSTGFPALKSAMASRKPTADNGSVFRYDTSSTGAIFSSNFAYRKGSWVLHMLRHIVGEANFFNTLAAYRAQFEYQSAVTSDFVGVAESVYGQDLDWFFQPWVYEQGAVSYAYSTANVTSNGKSYYLVKLVQTQSASYPTYSMPVDVKFTVGGNPTTKKLWNDARTEHYVIPVASAGSAIAIDPDGWILTRTVAAGTYSPGPPTIVEALTEQSPISGRGARFKVVFHTPVTVPRSAFELRSPTGARVAFDFQYITATNSAIITPTIGVRSTAGYTLTVRDTVKALNSGMALDGEIAQGGTLPTGNGQAGGSATITF